MNKIKELHHHPKSQKLRRGRDQKELQKKRFKKKNLRVMMTMMITYLMYPCKKKQGKDKNVYTTETTTEGWEAFEQVKMSKEYQVKPSSRIEPVIFEPQRKIKLSRSTYKVNSYIDFK